MKYLFLTSILIIAMISCAQQEENEASDLSGEELELEKEKIKATLTEMWDAVEKGDLIKI